VRTIRLYHSEQINCGAVTVLSAESSNHLIRVLRSKVNTPVVLFNGDGFDYQCKTFDTNSKKTQVLVETKLKNDNESSIKITLIQGLSRSDRMEATIQKSVELGVNKIIPVICQRSNLKSNNEKLTKKLNHWKKIALSACEQSNRCVIPEITDIFLFSDIKKITKQNIFNIALDPTAKTSINDLKKKQAELPDNAINVFIGPEGGFNDDEINLLENGNVHRVLFGPRVLRTETAGPAAISALQILWGDF